MAKNLKGFSFAGTGITFGDVAWNRDRCPSHLIHKTEPFRIRETGSQFVNRHRQFNCLLPNNQALEALCRRSLPRSRADTPDPAFLLLPEADYDAGGVAEVVLEGGAEARDVVLGGYAEANVRGEVVFAHDACAGGKG